tara:strand:+ start:2675 stop:3223 length:549 start_codon:yes stop_codon:yes gene_type:complete
MKNYITIDNFFNDPKKIKNWGLKQKFFTIKNHPWKESLGNFPGSRTNYINHLDKNMFDYIINNLLKACDIFYEKSFQEFKAWLSFSYTLEDIKLPDWHTDGIFSSQELSHFEKKLSGIVYLNENVKKECGTFIINNNKKFLIENYFNRLVLYPSAITHSLAKSFGKNKKNSRFVLTIMIYLK